MTNSLPPSEGRPTAAEDILAELFERRVHGEKIDIEEYCRLHPELADELRRAHGDLFGLFEELERLGNSYGDRAGPRPSSSSPEVDLGPSSALSRQILERLTGRKLPSNRYHLRGEVGRGGMGAVLRVWDEDLRRSLAMKVALEGGEGSAILREQRLARFLEEAQITGQLDHPGIVPIHELGVDEEGHVYFTMKLVQGRTLEKVIEEKARGEGGWTRTRLIEILLRICEAMAFAHSKGVIHRDLKPANVMVGRFGEVYVMDWGLARVSGQTERHDLRIRREDEESAVRTHRREEADSDPSSILRTLDGHVVGTPAYMSLEQARGTAEEITLASDVYSVGAILYHMLTGTMPYVGLGESPSNRVVWARVQLGLPAPIRALTPDVPGELVAICDKAMARAPETRYANMEALAADLRAFVEGRVVRTYETGALAELRKWVGRNRALAAAFAASLFLLVGGMGRVSYVQAREKRAIAGERDKAVKAETDARAQQEIADSEARKAWESLEFLQSIFGGVRPERGGVGVTVAEILEGAAKQLERPSDRTPEIQAALHELLGVSYTSLGMQQRAADHFRRSFDLRVALASPDPHEVWRSLNGLGVALRGLGRLEESEAMLREGLARVALSDGPEDWDTLTAANNLVVTLYEAREFDEAIDLASRALELQEQIWGPDDPQTFQAGNSVATLMFTVGREEEGRAMLGELLERAERVLGPEHGLTAILAHNLLEQLGTGSDSAVASAAAVGLDERMERIFGPEHIYSILAREDLARRAIAAAEFATAERLLQKNLEIQTRTSGPDDGATLETLGLLGLVLTDLGRFEEAEECLWQVVDRGTELFGERDETALVARHNMARLYAQTARAEEAEDMLRGLIEVLGTSSDLKSLDVAGSLSLLATIYMDRGDWNAAEPLLRDALARQERDPGESNAETLTTLTNLGTLLSKTGRPEEAETTLTRALALAERALGPEHPQTQLARQRLEDFRAGR